MKAIVYIIHTFDFLYGFFVTLPKNIMPNI